MFVAMLIFGLLTLVSAGGVIVSRNPLNSALWLVVTLFLVAVHFALLGADFLAALQIVVYAGAIMVLVIFVIMLLGLDADIGPRSVELPLIASCAAVAGFVGLMVIVLRKGAAYVQTSLPAAKAGAPGSVESVADALFTRFIYPFEVSVVLLLAAVIGAVVLAHEKKRPLPPGRGLKAKQVEAE